MSMPAVAKTLILTLAATSLLVAAAPVATAVPTPGTCDYHAILDPTCTWTFDPPVGGVIVTSSDDNFDAVHLEVCINDGPDCRTGCSSVVIGAEAPTISKVEGTASTSVDADTLRVCFATEGAMLASSTA